MAVLAGFDLKLDKDDKDLFAHAATLAPNKHWREALHSIRRKVRRA